MLARLGALFDRLAARRGIDEVVPSFLRFHRELRDARACGDAEQVEVALARLYCVIHGSGGAYAPGERQEFERLGGYWCHAGGIEPLHLAAPYIGAGSRLADYGAGNGFQGLLLQHLYPHRLTTLIELGGPMIEQGRRLQSLLGIPPERVRWVHASVVDVPPSEFDVIYLYRPLRPQGAGRAFYETFSREVVRAGHPVAIVSVADCLKDFLPSAFRVLHDDGQVAIFSNQRSSGARAGRAAGSP